MYYMIHLYEVKKQAKLLDSIRSQGSGYLSERVGTGMDWGMAQRKSQKCSVIDIGSMWTQVDATQGNTTQVNTYVKMH